MGDVVRDTLVAQVEKMTGRRWPDLLEEIVERTRQRHPKLARERLTTEREIALLQKIYVHESATVAVRERDRAELEIAQDLIRDAHAATGRLGGLL